MSNDQDVLSQKYPLVYKHARNYAAKLIQKSWTRYMMRITYKYLLECCHEFEANLNPKELSRIFPEFLESSDPKMGGKLRIRMMGESYPPKLVCRIESELTPSVDGGKHEHKWIPLYAAGSVCPIDQKALEYVFLEASHSRKEIRDLPE